MLYDLTYMWNLKKIFKLTEAESKQWLPGAGRVGEMK